MRRSANEQEPQEPQECHRRSSTMHKSRAQELRTRISMQRCARSGCSESAEQSVPRELRRAELSGSRHLVIQHGWSSSACTCNAVHSEGAGSGLSESSEQSALSGALGLSSSDHREVVSFPQEWRAGRQRVAITCRHSSTTTGEKNSRKMTSQSKAPWREA